MSRLRAPLRESLDTPLSEENARRIWTGISERRERRRARRRSAPLLLAAALALVISVVVPWVRRSDPDALAREDGQLLLALEGVRERTASLTDGSRIDLDPRAELDVLHNDGRVFVTVLRRGSATFDVRPGGGRRWTVETSLGSVDVLGTRFSVERDDETVKIAVSRGVVVVRAESLPERVRRLTAGEHVVLTKPSRGAAEVAPTAAEPVDVAPPRSSAQAAPSDLPAKDAPVPAEARSSALPVVSATPSPPSFDERLQLADRARASGDRAAAIEQLRAALADPTGGSRRAMAAFSLGKQLLDGGQPAEAATAFGECLSRSPPAALAEDALVRLIEAQARAGRSDEAKALSLLYQQRYPRGARRAQVNRWVTAP